jgi:outer membrane receptor for ferrienterochelin and colicins
LKIVLNKGIFVAVLAATAGLLLLPWGVFAAEDVNQTEGDVGEIKVVTSTKTERTIDEVPVMVEVITREELEAANVQTIQDALNYVTGVKSPSGSGSLGYGEGAVQIRGMEERHTLILIDGQRFYGGHDSVSLQSISVEMVEQIEIVKGPVSSLYGSDAMGGVINIITKKAVAKAYGSFGAEGGSRNTQVYEGGAGFRNDKSSGVFSFTNRRTDGVTKATDAYNEKIVNANFGYSFNPQSKLEIGSYYSLFEMDADERHQERSGLNLKWKRTADELSNWYIRSSLFRYKHWTDDLKSDWVTDSYEGEVGYSRLLGAKHLLTIGSQYHLEQIDDDGKDYEADQTTTALFVQDEIDLVPFQIILGTRLDHHELWGTQFNPNLSVAYCLSERAKLRGSIGKAFAAPPLVRLYADGWKMGPYTVYSNPDLKPEESVGYQVGIDYQFSAKVIAQATLFRNEVENLLSSLTDRTSRRMYWVNVGEALVQGLEVNLKTKFSKTLSGNLGFVLLDTEDRETGNELTSRAKNSLNLQLDWQANPGLNLNLSGLYIGERYEDADNTEKLDGYFRLDLSLEQKLNKVYRFFVKVNNILGVDDAVDAYDLDGVEYYLGVKARF